MSRMRLLRKALVFLPIVLLSFTSCALCLGEGREFATGADSDLNFMVYGDSFHYEVGSGLTIQLLTAYDEDGTQFSEAGIALTVSVGSGEKDEETINLTGKEPPGGFKEEWDRGMAWLRYWEAEEFFIPERAANVDWWRPWPFQYEESLWIPRFILGQAEVGRKTLSLGLYVFFYIPDRNAWNPPTVFRSLSVNFRWTGEDEIEILNS